LLKDLPANSRLLFPQSALHFWMEFQVQVDLSPDLL